MVEAPRNGLRVVNLFPEPCLVMPAARQRAVRAGQAPCRHVTL